MGSEVWIFAEQQDSRIRSVAFELLAEGRKLADSLQVPLCAVSLGHDVTGVEELIAGGADKVYLVDDASLADGDEDMLTEGLVSLVREHSPQILLAGATSLGNSVIPRTAASLHTGLSPNCTRLEIDPGTGLMMQTRSAYGGNVMAVMVCPDQKPQMATVRPHVFKKAAADASHTGKIVKVDFQKQGVTSRTRLIEAVKELSDKVKLEEADVIICGGRGMGSPDNFQMIEDLAQSMGAAVGATRPPVDDGWVPYSQQIGQTGKTVSSKVYIACGVSGAPQHLAGMQTSEMIIAINEDPTAPIFDIATYGIVGDCFKVLPLLASRIKASRE